MSDTHAEGQRVAACPVNGQDPLAVAASPDGSEVYVINNAGASVISTATQTATEFLNPGFPPARIAISPNGQTLYLTNDGTGTVAVVNAADPHDTSLIDAYGALQGLRSMIGV
jgi:DNA-binding beta-propeller fold protein YncE